MNEKGKELFTCEKCHYITYHIGHYRRHKLTAKHKKLIMLTPCPKKGQHHDCFVCTCGKQYKHNSSFCRHRKQCDKYIKDKQGQLVKQSESINSDTQNENETIKLYMDSNEETKDIDFKKMFFQMMNENKEVQNKLLEIVKEPRNITNNNQKTINIIQFLNEDCKDAMNLSDFLRNLVVTFEDLEKIEENGYLSGVKESLLQSLNNMEKCKRPIHCTDIKRKQFYVKDDNVWEKDMSQNKLSNAITQFNTTQMHTLSTWKKNHPEWIDDEKKQQKINKLNKELTSLYSDDGDKLKNKIILEVGSITNDIGSI